MSEVSEVSLYSKRGPSGSVAGLPMSPEDPYFILRCSIYGLPMSPEDPYSMRLPPNTQPSQPLSARGGMRKGKKGGGKARRKKGKKWIPRGGSLRKH